jgi:spectinomycin phosphotransferase
MTQTSPLTNQSIIDCLRSDYGIEAEALTVLPLRADRNATVYKAQTHDHSYFLKLKSGPNPQPGLAIVELLQKAGTP